MNRLQTALHEYPVIAAIRDEKSLSEAVRSPVKVVFILHAGLADLEQKVDLCRENAKISFVHLDMVAALSKDQAGLEFLAKAIGPEGVITTKPNLIKCARDLGLIAVERIFLLDSLSVRTGVRLAVEHKPDFLEVMPGAMPEVVAGIRHEVHLPLIAGGMITNKDQITRLMRAGVTAISTSRAELWRLDRGALSVVDSKPSK